MAEHVSPDAETVALATAVFRKLAAEGAAAPWESLETLAPALGAHIRHGLGTLVGRPGLDLRTRELVTVGILAAAGGCEPQLAFHTGGALRAGATAEEVIETLMQVSVYAGIPRTLNALAVAAKELETVASAVG